jgi:hypothetical protein
MKVMIFVIVMIWLHRRGTSLMCNNIWTNAVLVIIDDDNDVSTAGVSKHAKGATPLYLIVHY